MSYGLAKTITAENRALVNAPIKMAAVAGSCRQKMG
jgi:hypothetical protein